MRRIDGGPMSAASQEAATRVVQLKPLSAPASGELLCSEYRQALAPEFADACYRATGGNPFYLRELARALCADGIAPASAQVERVGEQGPGTVVRSLLTRIAALAPAAPGVARALAILGGEAHMRAVAGVSLLDERAVGPVIDALVGAEIVVGSDPVAFAHPIIRAAIYSDIPPIERQHAHLRAAQLLANSGSPAERVAVHLLSVHATADAWRVDVLRQAAHEALARGAPESAITYLSRAIAESSASNEREQLLALLGRAEYLAHRPGAAAHLVEAMAMAPTAARRGELALQAAQAMIMYEPDGSQAAIEVLGRALKALGAPDSQLSMRLEAHLLAAAGLKLSTRRTHIERLDEACARTLGDDPAARLLLANLGFWAVLEGSHARFQSLAKHANGTGPPAEIARRVAERAIANGQLLREEGPDSELFHFAVATLRLGDFLESSKHWLDQAIDDARRRGSRLGYAIASARLADVAYLGGNLGLAEAHARAAAEISEEDAIATLVDILVDQGRLGEARRLVEPYRLPEGADHLLLQEIRAAEARLSIAEGREEQASSQLLACGEWLGAWNANNPAHIPWRSTAALALAKLDQRDQARQLAEEEVALARALGQARPLGVALRALGLVVRGDDRMDLLEEAITHLELSPFRLEHARSLIEYGAAVRRTGHRADARGPLREGLHLAHRCGARALAERGRQELLATGARPRRLVLSGRDSLTPTEARVAQMAAEGQSTPEIAQVLFVSPKTVETHLGHVFRKLDIHGRAGLGDALLGSVKTTDPIGDR